MRKTTYTGKLPKSKRRTRKSFWVFFLVLQLTTLERKIKRSRKYFWIFSKFFKHTRRKRENKSNMNKVQTPTTEMCEHECKVGEKHVLPQAYAFGITW